jgi:hypothetical protein
LTSKGFDEVNHGDIFYHFIVNGKKSAIHTLMSHGETSCGTKCLTTMARQAVATTHGPTPVEPVLLQERPDLVAGGVQDETHCSACPRHAARTPPDVS